MEAGNWPPRFTMTPEAAARLVLMNYQQEQNEEKTVLAITMLMNEAFNKGKEAATTDAKQSALPNGTRVTLGCHIVSHSRKDWTVTAQPLDGASLYEITHASGRKLRVFEEDIQRAESRHA